MILIHFLLVICIRKLIGCLILSTCLLASELKFEGEFAVRSALLKWKVGNCGIQNLLLCPACPPAPMAVKPEELR